MLSWSRLLTNEHQPRQEQVGLSGANRDGVVRSGSRCSDVLGGKHRFPFLPTFTTHLPPGNLMAQARAL